MATINKGSKKGQQITMYKLNQYNISKKMHCDDKICALTSLYE